MIRAALAGCTYALALFALGFALGTARVLLIAPVVGELAAALIELPVMLAAALLACRWLVEHWQVTRRAGERLVMGAAFLVLLLGLETLLGVTLLGRDWAGQRAAFVSLTGLLGFAAQLICALLPLVLVRRLGG